MKFKRTSARYIPGLKHYKSHNSINLSPLKYINIAILNNKNNSKTYVATNRAKLFNSYKFATLNLNKSRLFATNKFKQLPTTKFSLLSLNKVISLILGLILITFGIISIISNTIVYTPLRFMNSLSSGVSFAITSLSLLIGIFILFSNRKKAVLGFILIGFGFLVIVTSTFFSLRMGLLPTSLLKTLIIFGSIFAGIGLIIKSIPNKNKYSR